MNNRIITDISNYIFVSDEPEKVDAIFLPGGSHPEQPEYAAELYRKGYAKWLVPSGGVSDKRDKWPGVRSKADIYNGDYQSDCEFFTDTCVKLAIQPVLCAVLRVGSLPRTALTHSGKIAGIHDDALTCGNVIFLHSNYSFGTKRQATRCSLPSAF